MKIKELAQKKAIFQLKTAKYELSDVWISYKSRDVFLMSREKKNTEFLQMCIPMHNATYASESAWKIKRHGWREAERERQRKSNRVRERKAPVDVKNEMTRCECIDGPALLQRACWRNEGRKKSPCILLLSLSSLSFSLSLPLDEYKIISPLSLYQFFFPLFSKAPGKYA